MRRLRLFAPALGLVLVAALAGGCNRNMEPFDPDETVEQPDLSRIFPEGAERTAQPEQPGRLPGAPPGPAPAPRPPPAPASASNAPPLSGTIRLADELEGQVPAGAILFLIARTGPSGPPTAVKRIPNPRFPLDFEIGPGDRMIQALPFEGPFQLTARVDADGNAMTRNPGDLQGAAQGSHPPGATALEILIDEIL